MDSAAEIVALLDLAPLPGEGGMFRRTFTDGASTAIYFLLRPGDFSALHRLVAPEVYHFYAGAPARLLLLDPATGKASEPVLGNDFALGQRPQLVVPPGIWQGSSTTGEWTLLGTTMAPGYQDEMLLLGHREFLMRQFPTVTDRVIELTR